MERLSQVLRQEWVGGWGTQEFPSTIQGTRQSSRVLLGKPWYFLASKDGPVVLRGLQESDVSLIFWQGHLYVDSCWGPCWSFRANPSCERECGREAKGVLVDLQQRVVSSWFLFYTTPRMVVPTKDTHLFRQLRVGFLPTKTVAERPVPSNPNGPLHPQTLNHPPTPRLKIPPPKAPPQTLNPPFPPSTTANPKLPPPISPKLT